MSLYTVTQAGKAALLDAIELTSDVIELNNGTFDIAWTMNATHNGNAPLDEEGWTPWSGKVSVQVALSKGYIEEVADAS